MDRRPGRQTGAGQSRERKRVVVQRCGTAAQEAAVTMDRDEIDGGGDGEDNFRPQMTSTARRSHRRVLLLCRVALAETISANNPIVSRDVSVLFRFPSSAFTRISRDSTEDKQISLISLYNIYSRLS